VERNRISSLQSHGKPLEKECCLPGAFCDSGDTPANYYYHYYSPSVAYDPEGWIDNKILEQYSVKSRTYYCYYTIILGPIDRRPERWQRHRRQTKQTPSQRTSRVSTSTGRASSSRLRLCLEKTRDTACRLLLFLLDDHLPS